MRSVFVLVLTITLFGCKKDDELVGDYVMCNINGQPWASKTSGWLGSSNINLARFNWRELHFNGYNEDDSRSLSVFVMDSTKNITSGTYLLGGAGHVASFSGPGSSKYDYTTDSLHHGFVTIIFTSDLKRVYGVFAFKAKLEQSDETIDVTNGKFSLEVY